MVQDKETQRQLRKARLFKGIAQTPEWKEAAEELRSIVSTLQFIDTLDLEKDVNFQIAVRKETARILYTWIGFIEKFKDIDKAVAPKHPWVLTGEQINEGFTEE